jgi:hypothetical protein
MKMGSGNSDAVLDSSAAAAFELGLLKSSFGQGQAVTSLIGSSARGRCGFGAGPA